jgi:hypothetical protein
MATATKKSSSSSASSKSSSSSTRSKAPSPADAEKLTEEIREIQQENALENLTNVPDQGGAISEVRTDPDPSLTGEDADDLKKSTELLATVTTVGNDLVLDVKSNPLVISGEQLKSFQRIFDRAARNLS